MSKTLKEALAQRPLLLDGAMGSMIQARHLPSDICGGNNDALVFLKPDVISDIHRQYLAAGADIITTCTFSAQRISQAEYGMAGHVDELNRAAARIAREEADRMTAQTPGKPRFVLGDVGPTGRMLSMSDNVEDPAARSLTFDDLEDAYHEQIVSLLGGGVDGILLETVFDTLNAKAGIAAYERAIEETGKDTPLLISMTISDKSGRTLSGQTVEAFVASVMHARPLCVGMNCGLGAAEMIPYLRRMKAALSQYPGTYVSCHPNAGLPNQFGEYEQSPESMAAQMKPMLEEGICRIVGGCCGTTPEHIKAISRFMGTWQDADKVSAPREFSVSGLELYTYSGTSFITVGERCNVAGSRKFLKLISNKQYDEALDIARAQIAKGAQVIDINMDDGMLDAREEVRHFVNLIASDPSVSRVPLMIDSSQFEVIEEGLKCCQGKCIVNSISLKQGEAAFLAQARAVRRLGAAVIVMCFDEQGQATDYERRIDIASRAYRLLTEEVGFPATDIIFDPNVLTIATGMEEHANYARDFIRATRWIRENLPGARVSGGLSNLSFAFRGNNPLREAMHSVFLHYAVEAGMGMAIMNPATAVRYEDIAPELRDALAAVILNTSPDATENLTSIAQAMAVQEKKTAPEVAAVPSDPAASLSKALVDGQTASLDKDIHALLEAGSTALQIISGPLMAGMNEVGRRFGEGRMFLPQVVRTARTMKRAVEILDPFIKDDAEKQRGGTAGRVILATVKGDVHDIGKNIVGVVMACNGFEVIDLGVMVPAEQIVREAAVQHADIICLSGLITPSLEEMCKVASALEDAGIKVPLFVGGATTSPVYTAVRLAPLYGGGVIHMKDASQNPVVAMQLMDPEQRPQVLKKNAEEQAVLREEQERKTWQLKEKTAAMGIRPSDLRHMCNWSEYKAAVPPFTGARILQPFPVEDLVPLIDWNYLYWAWRVTPGSTEARELRAEAESLLDTIIAEKSCSVLAEMAFLPAKGLDDSIEFRHTESECPCCGHSIRISTPRQALLRKDGSQRDECLSLCDYVSPDGEYVGVFACTVKTEVKEPSLLFQTICDRLVEAGSEFMARNLEERFGWGGIRPAIGYPSIPEQREIFKLAELLDLSALGITLTENGAMSPQSSVCGLLIANPEAVYFNI